MCTRHLVEKQGTEAGASNSYSLPLAILQLNCQLSSQLRGQTTGEEGGKELRIDLQPWIHPMLFCPRANLGDIKEKRDEMPPNDTQ